MKSFASQLDANFGGAELGIHSAAGFLHGRQAVMRRYDVHVLVVDGCGEHASVAATLLRQVAKSAGAGRSLYVQAASLVPAESGSLWRKRMDTICEGVGIEAEIKVPAALRPRDVGSNGGFDVVLTTDLKVLEQVRQLRPRTVGTYCIADFILSATGPDDLDAAAAIAAVIALPKPMRALLASNACAMPLNIHAELPTDSLVESEACAWETFMAVAIASSLGFTLRLKQLTRLHARSSLVQQLTLHFPTRESLNALEPHAIVRTLGSSLPAGVLSDAEFQMTVQAYLAALQISELGVAERKPPLPPV